MDNLSRKTAITKKRYDRISPFYDWMEWFIEGAVFKGWRRELWSQISPGRILEAGIGTGKNIPYYPLDAEMTAIDLSDGMLRKARRRAEELNSSVSIHQMDVQNLDFPDNTFDAAVATFVFCSVPIPVKGLQELGRVVKPDGDIWLLEHVRINKPLIGTIMDVLNPVIVRTMGANINRQTAQNVEKAGLRIVGIEPLRGELVKLIHAKPN